MKIYSSFISKGLSVLYSVMRLFCIVRYAMNE